MRAHAILRVSSPRSLSSHCRGFAAGCPGSVASPIPVNGVNLRLTYRRRFPNLPYLKRNQLTLPILVVPSKIK